jgi:hypothetical protein
MLQVSKKLCNLNDYKNAASQAKGCITDHSGTVTQWQWCRQLLPFTFKEDFYEKRNEIIRDCRLSVNLLRNAWVQVIPAANTVDLHGSRHC